MVLVESSYFCVVILRICQSQLPRGPRLWSAGARLLGLWVRIPPGAWMFVSCECCQVDVSASV